MVWIPLHDDIWENIKTFKLVKILGIDVCKAVGHLIALWHFTLRNVPEEGDLELYGIEHIEKAAKWDGGSGEFVSAMQEVGFMDDFRIHSWDKHAEMYHSRMATADVNREKTKERVRLWREKRKSNDDVTKSRNVTVTKCNAPILSNQANHIESNQAKQSTSGAPSPTDSKPKEEPVLTFPCSGDKSEWHLYPSKEKEWQASFPGLIVLQECKKARQWILDNPTKRKTYNGMTRFLGAWLGRVQNSGGENAKSGSGRIVGGAEPTEGKYDDFG